MVQSLSLFWPLILLAVVGIVAFLVLIESNRKARRKLLESNPDYQPPYKVLPRDPNTAVVRPGRATAIR